MFEKKDLNELSVHRYKDIRKKKQEDYCAWYTHKQRKREREKRKHLTKEDGYITKKCIKRLKLISNLGKINWNYS
jgi:hypothetical protein